MNPMMHLIGGPFDGASGRSPIAGLAPLWIYADPASPGVNGLRVALEPRSGTARYDLVVSAESFRYTFEGSDVLSPVGELESVA